MLGTTSQNLLIVNKLYPKRRTVQTYINQIPRRRFYELCKRFIDISFSLFITIFVLSWLLPLLALLIKLDSQGPVFFVQKRIGYMGRPFYCIKLRSMVVNDLSDQQQATPDDPRITRLGTFLRLSSLDELPQFFNVLAGHMSIVGPRPHMLTDNTAFNERVENYELRHFVRPGITGMAQVKGHRGPTENFHCIFHRYQWDAFYVRNTNVILDLKIIRLTASQMIKGIFGFRNATRRENSEPAVLQLSQRN